MSNNNVLEKKIINSLFITIFGMALATGCQSKSKYRATDMGDQTDAPELSKDPNQKKIETNNSVSDDKKSKDSAPQKVDSVVSFKTMRSLNATYASLTGVGPEGVGDNVDNTPKAIKEIYAELQASLPKDSALKSLSPTTISSVTKLAMSYCIALFNDTNLAAQTAPGIDLAAAKNTLNNDQAADALIARFWNMSGNNAPDEDAAKKVITDLLTELKADASVETNGQLMIAGCSVALASPIVAMR